MTKRNAPARHLWEDRFAAPTAERLVAALAPELGPHFAALRASLAGEHELRETVVWRGLPWRWTLSYRPAGSRDDHDPIAHLVPNPAAPSAIYRLSREEFTELPLRKLSRFIRDGLSQAKLVAGVSWPEWTIQSETQASELIDLFRLLRQRTLAGA